MGRIQQPKSATGELRCIPHHTEGRAELARSKLLLPQCVWIQQPRPMTGELYYALRQAGDMRKSLDFFFFRLWAQIRELKSSTDVEDRRFCSWQRKEDMLNLLAFFWTRGRYNARYFRTPTSSPSLYLLYIYFAPSLVWHYREIQNHRPLVL
jgi:hypothetical protein